MLNQYVARARVADWHRLADKRRLVGDHMSVGGERRSRRSWRLSRQRDTSPQQVAPSAAVGA
jgi:hypothetical protein